MDGILPGPPAIFVSGLPKDCELKMAPVLAEAGISDISVIFCTQKMVTETLREALEEKHDEPAVDPEKLPPVMVFSGISMSAVQTVLHRYQQTELPRPIFATTTEHNLSFTVKELIMHLLEERRQQVEGR